MITLFGLILAQNGKNRQIKSAPTESIFQLRQMKFKFFLAYTELCNDPKIKGCLNEMKFGTQINLVILNIMAQFFFDFEDTCHLLSPIWSRKFTENVIVAPDLENYVTAQN